MRRIASIAHDLEHDEMVYRCDRPLANDVSSLKALTIAKEYIEDNTDESADYR